MLVSRGLIFEGAYVRDFTISTMNAINTLIHYGSLNMIYLCSAISDQLAGQFAKTIRERNSDNFYTAGVLGFNVD